MTYTEEGLYFIYNENPRNFDREDQQKRINTFYDRQSVVALTSINKIGEVQTSLLYQNAEVGVLTRPKVCKEIGYGQMLIYGESERFYKFGLLQF